jgi:hypothetical protein
MSRKPKIKKIPLRRIKVIEKCPENQKLRRFHEGSRSLKYAPKT